MIEGLRIEEIVYLVTLHEVVVRDKDIRGGGPVDAIGG
jgi:hypothetical protein